MGQPDFAGAAVGIAGRAAGNGRLQTGKSRGVEFRHVETPVSGKPAAFDAIGDHHRFGTGVGYGRKGVVQTHFPCTAGDVQCHRIDGSGESQPIQQMRGGKFHRLKEGQPRPECAPHTFKARAGIAQHGQTAVVGGRQQYFFQGFGFAVGLIEESLALEGKAAAQALHLFGIDHPVAGPAQHPFRDHIQRVDQRVAHCGSHGPADTGRKIDHRPFSLTRGLGPGRRCRRGQ